MVKKKTTKVIIKKKKFHSVEIPLTNSKVELIGESIGDLKDKTINLDLTRELKGKSVEAIVKIKIEDNKAIAYPNKIKLMPYFIKRMIRKRISYIEDSFETPSQESLIKIKPFLITRKKVSKAVRKALRNRCKNWIEDYIAERKDNEIFNEILSNKMQRTLSLVLKKTYPLSLCEIRILEITRPLKPEEVPKRKKKKESIKETKPLEEEIIDQVAELEKAKKEKAEKEIEKTQKKALKIEDKNKKNQEELEKETERETKVEKTPKKIEKKIEEKND